MNQLFDCIISDRFCHEADSEINDHHSGSCRPLSISQNPVTII